MFELLCTQGEGNEHLRKNWQVTW